MRSARTAFRPMPRQGIIAREGFPFIVATLVIAAALGVVGHWILAAFVLCVAAFIAFFFRNPLRTVPVEEGLVVAPADGRVLLVSPGERAPVSGRESIKVSIFMSVFNVHINRSPIRARVREAVYSPGGFLVASLHKASTENERNALVLEDAAGREVTVVQIAGLIARRIICYVKGGDELARGAPFGLICFGSRVDLYLPMDARVAIRAGEKTAAGETIVGRLS